MPRIQHIDKPASRSEDGIVLFSPPRKGMRMHLKVVAVFLLTLVFCTGLFAGCQIGGTPASSGNANSGANATDTPIPDVNEGNVEAVREAVIARVRPSVVQINVVTQNGQGLGSGVIIDQRGYIITNNHVVEGATQVQVVLSNGNTLPAQLRGASPADDLAVVKITPPSSGLTVAKFGDSSTLRVGQGVLAIGNPLGITQTVTSGIVSALGRTVADIPDAIQTDAAINPGNSGGALVDLKGNLVGIPTATAIDAEFKVPANGVGFAVPSNRVQFIAPQIINNGSVTNSGRAALGVRLVTVDQALAQQNRLPVDRGALIVSVNSNGPADKAGLRAGDIIVQIDKKAVTSLPAVSDALVSKKPGDTVSVQVYRGSGQQTFTVTLGELSLNR